MKKVIRARSLNRAHLEAVAGGGRNTLSAGGGYMSQCPNCGASHNACDPYGSGWNACEQCGVPYQCTGSHQVRVGGNWVYRSHMGVL